MFKKKYNINNLFIASIGVVYNDDDNQKIICSGNNFPKNYIVVEKREGTHCTIGKSPINDVSYQYFSHCEGYLGHYIGQIMIISDLPLALCYKKEKTNITKDEIIKLEEEINSIMKDDQEEEIMDPVMREIKNISDLAKNILDEDVKKEIISKINSLATNYVEELIKIKTGTIDFELKTNNPEMDLINRCILELLTIEEEVKKNLSNNELIKDLQLIRKGLVVNSDR